MNDSAESREIDFTEKDPQMGEVEVLRSATETLRSRLPDSWKFSQQDEANLRTSLRLDAVLQIEDPTGERLTLAVEVKRLINSRDVLRILDSLREPTQRLGPNAKPMLIARYLPPATRELISAQGAGYADATGNLFLESSQPAIFLRDTGANKDPWRGRGRPRGTLKGLPAARVVRALIDFAPPYSVAEIAKLSGASMGATYRVMEFLDEEALITREKSKPISSVNWKGILERWSRDYGFSLSNSVKMYIEPRGIETLENNLRQKDDPEYVMTGSMAVETNAKYAEARLANLYVRDREAFAKSLSLRSVDKGANVALATGKYCEVVFERSRMVNGVRTAAVSQVAVDLLSGPGRNPAEGIALIDWMEANESTWRQ